jgi:hypothetical protein
MKLNALMLLASLAISATASAQAPAPEGRDAMMAACAADTKSLCADKTGRDAMMCLRSNTDKLSAPCKDAMSKMPARGPG